MSTKKSYALHNKVNADPLLSLKAKGVMFYLLSKPADWKGHVYDIARYCKDGKKSIMSAVRELKAQGYLRTIPTMEAGLFTGKHYKICYEK